MLYVVTSVSNVYAVAVVAVWKKSILIEPEKLRCLVPKWGLIHSFSMKLVELSEQYFSVNHFLQERLGEKAGFVRVGFHVNDTDGLLMLS